MKHTITINKFRINNKLMARTCKVFNRKAKVPYCTVERTLDGSREDSDRVSIRTKTIFLLKKNHLKSTGNIADMLKRLLRFYGENPESLPNWIDLSLYPLAPLPRAQPPRVLPVLENLPIIFELDDSGELFEV